MLITYNGAAGITGPLMTITGVSGVSFDEMAQILLPGGEVRSGRVIYVDGDRVLVQIFEGSHGIALDTVKTRFTGRGVELPLSRDMLGRTFDGAGRPADGLGGYAAVCRRDINGAAINPVARIYPRSCIYTGISSIDGMLTLIRGQKLPIFSGAGMGHNALAAQIVRQARIGGEDEEFAVVFAAIGVKNDTAEYFKNEFERSGALHRVAMFINTADDPIVERILTPRAALTCAEYLAFDLGMHVLVILTDMTAYCEALRELSSSKGEIPSRKGFPGYMYSDLASIYERAGMIEGRPGSVTQMPILTMPNDDINHPIPDLTGYITEGQIYLDRGLDLSGIYPPVGVLQSLSRLMKDGIGKGYTRDDHPQLANQLFASYARVQDIRALASVIGEDDLSDTDRAYVAFGRRFEAEFVCQQPQDNRSIEETLNLGWRLLSLLPPGELDRVDSEMIDKYCAKMHIQ